MKKSVGRIGIPYLTVIAGIIGYFFHASLQGGGSSLPIIAFSVLMSLLFLLSAASLEKVPEWAGIFRPAAGPAVLSVLGAALLLAGCLLEFRGGLFAKVIALLGVLSAAALAAGAVLCRRGKRVQPFLYVPATLFYVLKLFNDFRGWMVDPAIVDYAFSLFALIAFMISAYQTSAFCYDHGSRRQLHFFSLAGLFFGAAAMAGQSLPQLLIYGGSALWMLALSLFSGI